ncbi:hypothetical protein [Niabella ginsengisoli]|uniref:XRE family transcriptional regulator n=1 Tax=Niabella ginsengisoli TaxID=522298 RepID=A0ABS9SN10_9BACT|nr:hypothetical protein [Niabella ginsengisoli]MCH5599666.1 hypothetical protein [Niabella ginsengisoli]
MTNVITQYKFLLNSVPELINISGYKNDYIAQKLQMRPAYFSAKKQKGNWTIEEVEKILSTISNKDVQDYLDKTFIKDCFIGDTISSEMFEKKMGWK